MPQPTRMATRTPGSDAFHDRPSGHLQRGASRSGSRQRFTRALRSPGLTLLTIGGIMGSGLFLASGMAIRDAGPAVLGVFAIGFVAMYLEIRALAEMSVANPAPGSFLVYCRQVLGPGFSFVSGWIYWFSSVLTMSSEVTAAALLTRVWFPQWPVWLWALAYSVLIVGVNFVGVRGFGSVEAVLAATKILAVLAFIVLGGLYLTGRLPHATGGGLAALSQHGGLWPHGLGGAAGALLLVLFAYAGTGVIGMAAAETKDPGQTIPRTVRRTALLVGVMYLGGVFTLLALVPWWQVPVASSPFVAAVARTGLPFAAGVMNLVLLLAVLSTMNAALYANVRVLYSLASQKQAPAAFGRLSRRGVPANATWASATLLAATIALAYVLPHKAYAYLVTATGFQAMFIWLTILLTHIRYRPYLRRHRPERLTYRLFAYPYTTLVVIAIVLSGLAGSLGAGSERIGAGVGLAGIVAALVAWLLLRRRLIPRMDPVPPPDPQSPG